MSNYNKHDGFALSCCHETKVATTQLYGDYKLAALAPRAPCCSRRRERITVLYSYEYYLHYIQQLWEYPSLCRVCCSFQLRDSQGLRRGGLAGEWLGLLPMLGYRARE